MNTIEELIAQIGGPITIQRGGLSHQWSATSGRVTVTSTIGLMAALTQLVAAVDRQRHTNASPGEVRDVLEQENARHKPAERFSNAQWPITLGAGDTLRVEHTIGDGVDRIDRVQVARARRAAVLHPQITRRAHHDRP